MPNYRRVASHGQPVFVTLVTRDREPWLGDPRAVDALLATMRASRCRLRFRHLAHCVLPDHVHLLIRPTGEADVSRVVSALKRDFYWCYLRSAAGPVGRRWQRRFYDHVIRDDHDLRSHLDYVHFNPVRHGHVRRAGEWPHSSFRAWVARGVYEEDWGEAAPEHVVGMSLE